MKIRKLALLAVTMAAAVLGSACGRAADMKEAVYAEEKAMAAPMAEAAGMGFGNEYYDGAAVAETAAETAAASTEEVRESRKLIRNIGLTLETKELQPTVDALEKRVKDLGGYVENMNISIPSGESYYGSYNAWINARIPSDRADDFIEDASGIANLTYKSDNVEDVTLHYADTESHLESLRIEQDRLNELLKKAEDIEAIVALEQRLSDVRYQIESYQSQLRVLDNQIEYTTVSVSIEQVTVFKPVTQTPGERIREGFAETVNDVKESCVDLAVWLIVKSPVLIIVAVIVAIIVLVIRSIVKKELKKKEARKAAAQLPGTQNEVKQ